MSIIFNEETLGVWYVLLEPEKMDYMGALSRRPYGYMYTWRMRYYDSPTDAWDGKDEKRWFTLRIPSARGDEEEVTDIIREMVVSAVALGRAMGKPDPGPIYELVRGTKSFDEFAKEFTKAPFVHTREATKH